MCDTDVDVTTRCICLVEDVTWKGVVDVVQKWCCKLAGLGHRKGAKAESQQSGSCSRQQASRT
jgi:hypothetical protein